MARRGILRAAALAALLAAGPAGAQTGPGAQPPQPPVLVIDMERVQTESAAARSIRRQTAEIRQRIQQEIEERETVIRAEERKLAEERESLSAEAFRERRHAFEEQVFATRRYAQSAGARLQGAISEAGRAVQAAITPILAELLQERGAQVLLDSSRIILSIDRLDITDEAIAALDDTLPEVPLNVDPAPE